MKDIFPVLISVFCSITIALIGWNILFRNAKKLASRSETYTIISSVNSLLKEIKEASDSYWLRKENNDSPVAYDTFVALKLREVQGLLKILSNRHLSSEDGARAIYPIRSACTLNSTKASTISNEKDRATILRGIYGVVSVCEREIYDAFEKKYPPLK
ncbi:hypothetical protein [Pseudoalteromonas sp. Z9A6]|uniref:hypothetical protein n=1 Tax=Pseudoalteromonas sp. Z9A6 TaxID=2686352 RepID=UPI0013FD5285|nr:hypothetical protein [Pseudoalteromonas sp. Z9A6]